MLLSFHQLIERSNTWKRKSDKTKLELYVKTQQNSSLRDDVSLSKSILMLIANNNIPRVHQLIKNAVKHRRSSRFIIEQVHIDINMDTWVCICINY